MDLALGIAIPFIGTSVRSINGFLYEKSNKSKA